MSWPITPRQSSTSDKFDFVAGCVGATGKASLSLSTGITNWWNGNGNAPIITGMAALINANASAKEYQASLLLYTAGTIATVLETVSIETTTSGEAEYSMSFLSTYPMLKQRYYGLRIIGIGEAYYTQATWTYTGGIGPGHLATMAQHAPIVGVGQGGAIVRTGNHLTQSGLGIPQVAVPAGTCHPMKLVWSNAS